jgi:AcrR family transcriptional regulator
MTTTPEIAELGLRERKKQQTREHIASTALGLFLERGFDAVTVAEIARAADVSEKTVFNYFARKEDLVYWRLESFEQELLSSIRERSPGESAFEAFARFVLVPRGLLSEKDPRAVEQLAALTRMIIESPALLAREREIYDRYTASLAALLGEETGAEVDDLEPRVAAEALMAVHRSLVDYSRGRIVAGERNPRLLRGVRRQGKRALDVLECGLGSYAVKRPAAG